MSLPAKARQIQEPLQIPMADTMVGFENSCKKESNSKEDTEEVIRLHQGIVQARL